MRMIEGDDFVIGIDESDGMIEIDGCGTTIPIRQRPDAPCAAGYGLEM